MTPWLKAVAAGIGVFLALEVPLLFLRRSLRSTSSRFLYHLWALAVGAVAFFYYGDLLDSAPRAWQATAALAIVLSALVAFVFLSTFLLARPSGPRGVPAVPKLVRDVLGWIVFVAALLGAVTALEITKLTTVLVSSTVLSAVVGLALQDVLKNLVAGVALQSEGTFATGDWLLLDGQPAEVLEMSWRTTHLRNNDGHDIFEPNAALANQRIVNLGSGGRPVAWNVRIGLPYGLPPAEVKAALATAVKGAEGVAPTPEPGIFVESFGDSAIVYRLRVWMREPTAVARFVDGVNSRIWYELRRAGIEVPYPMRVVELHDADKRAATLAAQELARRRELIDRLPLFAELTGEHRAQLAAAAVHHHYDRGEKLVREGTAGDSLFILDRGRVMVSKSGEAVGTKTLRLAALGEGEVFGEMSLLTGEPRSATVTADSACEVLVLERDAIAPILAADPAIAEALSRVLADRVAATAQRLEDRRDRPPLAEGSDQASFLRKIRAFFRL